MTAQIWQDRDWRDNLILLRPYVAGEQRRSQNLIKLNTNESPFPPPPLVAKAIREFDADSLSRYPDPNARELVRAIAEQNGVPEEMVFVGNGSDEVLAFAFRAFFNSKQPVLLNDVTYSFYPVWCRLFHIPTSTIVHLNSFRVPVDSYVGDLGRGNGGIVIANPNAPTGEAESVEFFEQMLYANPSSVVIVDEAYYGFGADTVLPLTLKYDNLFVTRTLSKAGSLAGLRLGMGFGSPELMYAINSVKDSFNSYTVGSLAQRVGIAAIAESESYAAAAAEIIGTRERFTESMRGLGFNVLDSKANFVFVTHPKIEAEKLYEWLKEREILVRWLNSPAVLMDYLRITIGLEKDMDALLAAIGEYMREKAV